MVNKLSTTPKPNEVYEKINEIIDAQTSGGITVDDELSRSSTNPVENCVITNKLDAVQPAFVAGNNIHISSGDCPRYSLHNENLEYANGCYTSWTSDDYLQLWTIYQDNNEYFIKLNKVQFSWLCDFDGVFIYENSSPHSFTLCSYEYSGFTDIDITNYDFVYLHYVFTSSGSYPQEITKTFNVYSPDFVKLSDDYVDVLGTLVQSYRLRSNEYEGIGSEATIDLAGSFCVVNNEKWYFKLPSGNSFIIDADVPTDLGDLTNNAGYTKNIGTVTSVNNVSPVNGNVTLNFQQPLVAGDNISIDTVTPITLPNGYTQLTYIESSGSQYIDTGWTYNGTYPIQIDCKFKLSSFSSPVGSYPTPYGLQTSAYTEWLYPFYTSDGIFKMHLGSSAVIDSVPASLGRIYDTSLTLNNGTWSRTINGDATTGTWGGTITTSANLFLCAGSAGTSSLNQMIGNIYSFKITVNNTIVRNYVPCKRNSDSAVGMYDLATNTFKSSEVSSFLPGSEVTNGGEMISAIIPTPPTYNFHGVDFYSTNSTNVSAIGGDCNALTSNGHYYYTSNGPSGLGEQSTDGALYVQAYSTNWVVQTAQDYRTGNLFTRSRNNGTWTPWKTVGDVNSSSLTQVQCVVEAYSNGTSWYRVWSDGWCEQGGRASTGAVTSYPISFIKEMANTNYLAMVSNLWLGDDTGGVGDYCLISGTANYGKSTTGLRVSTISNANYALDWMVCGYIH